MIADVAGFIARHPTASCATLTLDQVKPTTFMRSPVAVEGRGGAGYVACTAGAEDDALEHAPAFFEFGSDQRSHQEELTT
ncbi:hypothetical protein [Streptomyces stackebrandtii]|uniref:hypothetical protein n=1 Tax=Streptomyces stackebrandtii TaxID=3051177 RepID=UPI0028DC6837|nr:hypothetical protein [Streptomyces sp. DSM 40976]